MVARAVGAGIAIGVGAVMALPQIIADRPSPALVIGGLLLIVLGAGMAGDLAAWERTHGHR